MPNRIMNLLQSHIRPIDPVDAVFSSIEHELLLCRGRRLQPCLPRVRREPRTSGGQKTSRRTESRRGADQGGKRSLLLGSGTPYQETVFRQLQEQVADFLLTVKPQYIRKSWVGTSLIVKLTATSNQRPQTVSGILEGENASNAISA